MSVVTRSPSGRVQERLIAALVPNAADRPELVAPAPLPMLPALRRVTDAGSAALVVATARMDGSGRVHERILLRALGWEPGHRLDIDTLHGVIVIAANSTGHHAVDHRGALQLPAALRHLCGIEPGPPLVLVAAIRAQVMVVQPAVVVAELLAAHYTTLLTTQAGS